MATVVEDTDVACARELLLDIYDACGGDHWFRNQGWGRADRPLSDWSGVATDDNGFPLRVNLGDNNLVGELPELTMKWFLNRSTVFYVDSNPRLTQDQPGDDEVATLRTLYDATLGRRWAVARNWLDEDAVTSWSGVSVVCGYIHVLWLSRNQLRGQLPNLSSLKFMRELHLQRNHLHGSPISGELQACPMLSTLRLDFNDYNCNIASWTPPPLMERLCMQFNRIYGQLPRALFDLPKLRVCELHMNTLDEPLPDNVPEAPALRQLTLYRNPAARIFDAQAYSWRARLRERGVLIRCT